MLFRVAVALFVLVNSFSANAQGLAEVTVVGPTDNTAAFIAVRPPTQPESNPVQTPITGTASQPAVEEPQGMTRPMAVEPQPPQHMPETMIGRGTETPRMRRVIPGSEEERMRAGMMERFENAMGRPAFTAEEREMLRGVIGQMWEQRRPRRLQRRSGGSLQPSGTVEVPRVTTPVPSAPETPHQERPTTEQPTIEHPTTAQPTIEHPTTEQPTMERPPTQQPATEQPLAAPETQQVTPQINEPVMEQPTMEGPPMREPEQATPPAGEMSVSGARFNTAVGDIDISSAELGREEQRTVPRVALRNVDFNTFVGRLRAGRTEVGRGAEPQWEQVWMPRRREWMPRGGRFEWMPRREIFRGVPY